MEFSQLIVLSGIAVVIAGFMLKLEPILIVLLGIIVTAVSSLMSPVDLLTTLGTSFVNNRVMATFILVLLVTGTMERNGLRETAAKVIGKVKGASPGAVVGSYGIFRAIFAMFNVAFGGVAGFVRPVIMPMATGAIEAQGDKPNEEHVEQIKGMASAMENVGNFFFQVLFITAGGNLLVQSTLAGLGYEVELVDLMVTVIPVSIFAIVWATIFFYLKDRRLRKKYYGKNNAANNTTEKPEE